MDDIYDDQHEENDEGPVPLTPKLDIEEILKHASRTETCQTSENEAVEKANFEWASQFAGNYLMMRHIIDEKIRRGDVPEFRKRKRFAIREFKLFRNI